jgi:hypothetical protein
VWSLSDGHVKHYDILTLSQRENTDERTLGDLFYDYGRPLPNIEIAKPLNWLLKTITGLDERFEIIIEILDTIFDEFKEAVPSSLVRLLGTAQ